MRRQVFKGLRTATIALVCLAMAMPAPVWAGGRSKKGGESQRTEKAEFEAFLPGVDRCGCLTECGGVCARFCAVINTCTGKFTGSADGCVENKSCRKQCYKNLNLIKDCRVRVECSVYTVQKKGKACYTASGCIVADNVENTPS